LEEILLKAWTGWSRLVTPLKLLDKEMINGWKAGGNDFTLNLSPDNCTWQASFTNLRTLHFSLGSYVEDRYVTEPCLRCGIRPIKVQALAGLLQETSIGLRAAKVMAVIERIPLFSTGVEFHVAPSGPSVYCECSKRVSHLIAQMATKPKD
jgi:hypothetical protein